MYKSALSFLLLCSKLCYSIHEEMENLAERLHRF